MRLFCDKYAQKSLNLIIHTPLRATVLFLNFLNDQNTSIKQYIKAMLNKNNKNIFSEVEVVIFLFSSKSFNQGKKHNRHDF